MMRPLINKFLLVTTLFLSTFVTVFAQHEEHAGAEGEKKEFNVGEMIMHHIKDDYGWELAHGLTIPLPIILYSQDRGVEVFSSSNFGHDGKYNGYVKEHNHIYRAGANGEPDKSIKVYDFSITKNVASLLLSAIILIIVFFSVGSGYRKNHGKAPKGIQSFMEPLILFVRDEIAKPNLGPNYERYLPYLLTLFFFILVNNLLGLLPGAANLTGNIAVTLTLAVITALITNFSGNKDYWKHIFAPSGVPIPLLPVIIPVEVVGLFVKPISLMIRLFANITAGHIIILSLLGLIFIARNLGGAGTGWGVSLIVTPFTIFMNLIELLVAFLQSFIFTLLTAMYIGSATEEHHHGGGSGLEAGVEPHH